MSGELSGIHHITAIAGDPQRNLDFYTGLLGLRLVKLTVNFDDPESYHLYYGDALGRPGSILTFFAWPGGRAGHEGAGQINQIALSVPPDTLAFWHERLQRAEVAAEETTTGWRSRSRSAPVSPANRSWPPGCDEPSWRKRRCRATCRGRTGRKAPHRIAPSAFRSRRR